MSHSGETINYFSTIVTDLFLNCVDHYAKRHVAVQHLARSHITEYPSADCPSIEVKEPYCIHKGRYLRRCNIRIVYFKKLPFFPMFKQVYYGQKLNMLEDSGPAVYVKENIQ